MLNYLAYIVYVRFSKWPI